MAPLRGSQRVITLQLFKKLQARFMLRKRLAHLRQLIWYLWVSQSDTESSSIDIQSRRQPRDPVIQSYSHNGLAVGAKMIAIP